MQWTKDPSDIIGDLVAQNRALNRRLGIMETRLAAHVWIQFTDPGGAAADGDVWIRDAGGVSVRRSGAWLSVSRA